MKFISTFLAAASMAGAAFAQNMTMGEDGLAAALQANNLTTLAAVLGAYPNITMALMDGNYTVFAPNDAAFAEFLGNMTLSDVTSNSTLAASVAETLMYHVAPGTYPESAIPVGSEHVIVPSLLDAPLLGDNMTAPLVLSVGVDGRPRIRLVDANVTVLGNATYENLLVHVIDQVLTPPQSLTATVEAANLTALAGALTAVSADLPMMLEMTPRLTIFAPVNEAFGSISETIATLNTSTIANVLLNHVINGTVVYSTEIMDNTTAISAAGQEFTFSMMNGTVVVMSGGQAMANVVRTDIPIENGVVHLIDAVLANTMSNPEAAMSAASSYAEAAATAMPTEGPIGGAAAAPTAGGNTGAASKNALVAGSTLLAAAAGVAVLAL